MVSRSCKKPVSPKPWPCTIPQFTRQSPSVLALTSAGLSADHSLSPWLSFDNTITTPHGSPWVRLSATQQPRLCLQNTESGIGSPPSFSGPKYLCSTHCPPGSSHDVPWCAWNTADACVRASALAASLSKDAVFLHSPFMGLGYKKLSWGL